MSVSDVDFSVCNNNSSTSVGARKPRTGVWCVTYVARKTRKGKTFHILEQGGGRLVAPWIRHWKQQEHQALPIYLLRYQFTFYADPIVL